VGVNAFQVEEERPELERLKVDPAIEEAQRARLQALRARRDGERVSALLSRIEEAARRPEEPLMPLFVEAVAADATLGEICEVLRRVWGEYQPPEVL
jgi:methylmalonyl-CoA mutase N-terminal domain/subunit